MVKRYPDHITLTKNIEPTQNATGDWVEGSGTADSLSSVCRFQPAGANNVIRGQDGVDVRYDYKVFLPSTSFLTEYGDIVTGLYSGNAINGTVKGHHNRQTHTVLWV